MSKGLIRRIVEEYIDQMKVQAGQLPVTLNTVFASTIHAARHLVGGADPIDVTDLDGFPGGSPATKFLREDRTWDEPPSGGDVEGPSSSVDGEGALFDGTTGKLLKRATGTGIVHRTSGVDSVSNVTEAEITTADNTTNDVSTSKHGFAPKAPNDATRYLDGTGAYSTPAGSGGVGTATVVVPSGDDSDADNTLHNDPAFLFAVGANQVFVIELYLMFTSGASNVPDVSWAFTFPANATLTHEAFGIQVAGTAITAFALNTSAYQATTPSTTGAAGVLTSATAGLSPLQIRATLRTGATTGTLQFQWAQNTTTGGTPTVRKGDSWMRYTRVS